MKSDITSTTEVPTLNTLSDASLDEWKREPADPCVPAGLDIFTVHDHTSANWVVRKIRESRAYADRVSAWAGAEARRAEREEQYFWHRYGQQLTRWAAEEIRSLKGRRKSLNLPAGTIGFRTELPKLVVVDDGRLLAWCRKCLPEAVNISVECSGTDGQRLKAWQQTNCPDARLIEQVAKSCMNDHVKQTGEIPDGIEPVEGLDKFYVK